MHREGTRGRRCLLLATLPAFSFFSLCIVPLVVYFQSDTSVFFLLFLWFTIVCLFSILSFIPSSPSVLAIFFYHSCSLPPLFYPSLSLSFPSFLQPSLSPCRIFPPSLPSPPPPFPFLFPLVLSSSLSSSSPSPHLNTTDYWVLRSSLVAPNNRAMGVVSGRIGSASGAMIGRWKAPGPTVQQAGKRNRDTQR